mgnify:CR=1 FL=1
MIPSRQIILDTETTGLEWKKGNRVVEIGCVELVERRPTGRTFHCYLSPDREFDPGAQEVTGLTLEFLADKPGFAEIAELLSLSLRTVARDWRAARALLRLHMAQSR